MNTSQIILISILLLAFFVAFVLWLTTPKLIPSEDSKILFDQRKIYGESENRLNIFKLYMGYNGIYIFVKNNLHLQITNKELIVQPNKLLRITGKIFNLYFKYPIVELSLIEHKDENIIKINFKNHPSFVIKSKRYKEILTVFEKLLPDGFVKEN